MLSRQSEALFVASLVGLSCPLAPAQEVTTSYGIDFVTVGDPGNRDSEPMEQVNPSASHLPRGAVGFEFGIAVTELTITKWIEFCEAYAPFVQPRPGQSTAAALNELAGGRVSFDALSGEFMPDSLIGPNDPATMSWEFATRYANWLHNDKALSQSAFESGAYDTSTFTFDNDGNPLHAMSASPNARFRLPTEDEWVKAVFYDPTRYENSEGGYWSYPLGDNDAPIPGLPGDGGETSYRAGFEPGPIPLPLTLPVGSYPESRTPWGLLDATGGVGEWTESLEVLPNGVELDRDIRVVRGSFDTSPTGSSDQDALEWNLGTSVASPFFGLRLVHVVPGPSVIGISLLTGVLLCSTQRRETEC